MHIPRELVCLCAQNESKPRPLPQNPNYTVRRWGEVGGWGLRFIMNKQEIRRVYIFNTTTSMFYLRCNLLPTLSVFFIPLLDLLVSPSPGTPSTVFPSLSPLILIYLLFSHTPNLWSLCQFQGPGTDPNGRMQTQFSVLSLCLWVVLRVDTCHHSGRAVSDMKRLHSLKYWDRGFESNKKHGCLFELLPCLFCPVLSNGVATGLIHPPRSRTNCLWQEIQK